MHSKKMLGWVGLIALVTVCKQPHDDLFTRGETMGLADSRMVEASGLVASINNPGYLWSHNDGGNPAELFLIDEAANIKMVCTFNNIQNRDWEDIAIATDRANGKNYIYLGDIGDNRAEYAVKLIYRFEEPVFLNESNIVISSFDTLVVKLPDGIRDAEALMVEPVSNDLFLFSKREDSVRLYQLHYPIQGDTLLAKQIAKLPFHNINAADISKDGTEVLIKNYDHIYYWKKDRGESIADLLLEPPISLPYHKGAQDEAIAWKADGSGFFTLGETVKKEKGELVFHKRKTKQEH